MKKLLFISALFLVGINVFSQFDTAALYNEVFPTDFYKREFRDAGKVGKADIKLQLFTDLKTNIVSKKIRFSFERSGSNFYPYEKYGYLDIEVLDMFMSALTIMNEAVVGEKPKNDMEIVFKQPSGIKLILYYESFNDKWKCYMQLNDSDIYSRFKIDPLKIQLLYYNMEMVKGMLKE